MEKKLNELQGELQAAQARIAQLELERHRIAATEITLNNGRQTTIGDWQNEINQFRRVGRAVKPLVIGRLAKPSSPHRR